MALQAQPNAIKRPSMAECNKMLTFPGGPFEMETRTRNGQQIRTWKGGYKVYRTLIGERMGMFADRVFLYSPLPEPADRMEYEHYSFAQTYIAAVERAAWMYERGVRMGSRVAVGGRNSAGLVVAFLAVHLLGAVPVVLNSTLRPDAQIHCLKVTQPHLVLVDYELANQIAPLHDSVSGKIYTWSPLSYISKEARLGVQEAADSPHPVTVRNVERGENIGIEGLGPDSDGIIFFTSGTTGMPKAVLATQQQSLSLVLTGDLFAARGALRAGAPLEAALAVIPAYNIEPIARLVAVPLFHVAGVLGGLVRGLLMGDKLIFMRRWNVGDAVKLIVKHDIKAFGGVPAIATAIIQSGLLPKDYVPTSVAFGGAPPPPRLPGELYARWPGISAANAYGMTETSGVHTGISGIDYVERPESVGYPTPIAETRIVCPETGRDMNVGEIGLIFARGGHIMKEYVNNPKATRETIAEDGWLNTGDMGMLDEDGFLYIKDRAKDMIIRGGENIASIEVENAILADERVAEAAAVPVPHPVFGELVGVAVSLMPGGKATSTSIMAEAAARLRYAARPAMVLIMDEPLPRNANGKIQKIDLKRTVGEAWRKLGGDKAKL